MINLKNLFLFLLAALSISACVDKEFDEPPTGTAIEGNVISITEMKSLYTGGSEDMITGEVFIKGIVVADDASGNFFKSLVIQDETGGINIQLDQNELNAAYPIGREVFVYLDSLYIGPSNGLLQLGGPKNGGAFISRIPDALVEKHVISSVQTAGLAPNEISMAEFVADPGKYYNTLIKMDNVEFTDGDAGATYATAESPSGPLSENRRIRDCDGNEVIMRNSGFADFANERTPLLNGSVTAVASVFNSDLQVFIRDTTDVVFTALRCDGSGGTVDNQLTIASLRADFENGEMKAPEGFIKGVVISDFTAENITGKNIHIQDASGGIVIRFTDNHSFSLGTELEVNVTGVELSEFNGLLQLNNVSLAKAVSKGNVGDVTPQQLTISAIKGNFESLESTLVLIKNVTITGSATFNGTTIVTDATGNIEMFTRSFATFSGDAVPSGTVDIVAIVSQFNVPQIAIRNKNDIK